VGPTSTGKTKLSLALARRLGVEVVACDSRTVYRYMDIGTAKPSAAERASVPHHMLDLVNPDQSFTAAMYAAQGKTALEAILSAGKLPVVCGGTGLYARALLEGIIIPAVPPQPELRGELSLLADLKGNQALVERLRQLDPVSAGKIGVNDRFRLVRALEVCQVTGRPFSQVATKAVPPWRTLWIGLTVADKAALRKSIQARFQEQMRQGMLAEVQFLSERFGFTRAITNTVNYRQLSAYLQGKISAQAAEEESVRHNWQLSRRQLIWFRANPAINWLEIDKRSAAQLLDTVLKLVSDFI